MPEQSRAQSRGRRSWSMRVARTGSHPAAGAGAGPGVGGSRGGGQGVVRGRRRVRAGLGPGTWRGEGASGGT